MESRLFANAGKIVVPHRYPRSLISRYLDWVMRKTYEDPSTMIKAVSYMGPGWLGYWLVDKQHRQSSNGFNFFAPGIAWFAQRHLFCFPSDHEDRYTVSEFKYKSAQGVIIIEEGNMPRLQINAEHHFDAGYVEGYLLAQAMKDVMEHSHYLYPAICKLYGAPRDRNELKD